MAEVASGENPAIFSVASLLLTLRLTGYNDTYFEIYFWLYFLERPQSQLLDPSLVSTSSTALKVRD